MKKFHEISRLFFQDETMIITIDGFDRAFQLHELSSRLHGASEIERNTYEISPSGYGIHWPLLDEDLSIDGLLNIVHKPVSHRKSA